jgi:hypothetical protein
MKENVSVVTHPIFLRCCQYLSDPFWIYLFEDMAYGKCPYGIILKDNCIYSVLKNREFTYSLLQSDKDTKTMCEDLCTIFSSKLHLLSQKDHFRYRTECQDYVTNYMNNMYQWNDIRKKSLKDLLLEQYSLTQKQKYNYSYAFTRKLFAIVFIGIQFKTILSKHIHYRNRSIRNIDGVECKPSEIVCSFNIFVTKSSTSSSQPPKNSKFITKLSLSWKRYLLSL